MTKTDQKEDLKGFQMILGRETFVSTKVNFWFTILLSCHFIFFGIRLWFKDTSIVGGPLYVATGLLFLLHWALYFTDNPWSPKLIIEDDQLSIKAGLRSKLKTFRASDISCIQFRSYHIIIGQEEQSESLRFKINSATSIELKKRIRAWAEEFHIPVYGG